MAAASLLTLAFVSPPAVSSRALASSAQPPSNVAKAWGLNKDGELGDGTSQSSDVPVGVGGLRGVIAIAGGSHHSLALLKDGTVMAWGENFYAQLGDGTEQTSHVPVAVKGLSEVVAIAAGEYHSLALLRDGTVMAWGRNSSGQLGDGSTTGSTLPGAVGKLSRVTAISAGGSFSLALQKDGTVATWGENAHGELGNGSTQPSDVPVRVTGLTGVTEISAGSRHGLALLSNGTVMAWGGNEYGQLGDRTETQRDTPVTVSTLTGVSAIAAGESHSLAIVPGGAVAAWGDNEEGQLGDGNHAGPERCGSPPVVACGKAPVAVPGLSAVTAIAAGNHSLALLADGAVMAWGPNNVGQLGDGSRVGPEACGASATACSTMPVPSRTQSAVSDIAAGTEFSLALGPAPQGTLPELGRCVKVASGGAYRRAGCTALSAMHRGHFEWLPGPGSSAKFTDRLNEPQLETVGTSKLHCRTAFLEGEYIGAKVETIGHVRLAGCVDVTRDASCQTNPLEEGVIASSLALEGDLGFISSRARPSIGWAVKPKPPATSLLSFDCGSGTSARALALEGSVIGRATPVNKTALVSNLAYTQNGGRQIPEFFAGEVGHALTLTTTPLMGESVSEQAGLRTTGVRTGEEALEIKTKI